MKGAGSGHDTWSDRLADRLTPRFLRNARAGRIKKRLLHGQDDDEDIVDEVYHHRVVYLPAVGEALLAGLVVVWAMLSRADNNGPALLLLLAFGLLLHAGYLWLEQFLDIFVITNVRVLRVSGLLNIKQASTPLSRILDITLDQPLLGRMLRYGHFVFESAAHDQGLRDIRFVPHPLIRDQRIQTLQMDILTGRRTKGATVADPQAEEEDIAPVDLEP